MTREPTPILRTPTGLPDWLTRLGASVTLANPADRTPTEAAPCQYLYPDLAALVSYETRNAALETREVLLPGGALLTGIEDAARQALHRQHDIDGAVVLRVTVDFTGTRAARDTLDRITRDYRIRQRFDAESG